METPQSTNCTRVSFEAAAQVLAAINAENHEIPEKISTKHYGETNEHSRQTPSPNIRGYIIDCKLGAGASGITYLAYKSGTEAKVALKILRTFGHETASQRAWRELEILQRVRDPCVPRLLDYGTADHTLYIATEFLDGTPLDRLYDHALPANTSELRQRTHLLERLARATYSLHEHGVIHRDLKPSNVIVTPNGTPFIIDLGIALIDAPDLQQTLTVDGTPIGTPAFMAPEQARGKRSEIVNKCDIYALGAIGYWLCTGQTPHDLAGVTLHEAIRRVGSDPPRQPRDISAKLPKPLAAILAKACAPKPADRYTSAAELANDLGRWRERKPVHATKPGIWRRCARWIETHPMRTTAIACLTLLASTTGLSFGVVWWLNHQPHSVQLDPNNESWVRLLSRSGNILKEWNEPRNTFPAALASHNPKTRDLQYVVLARWQGNDPNFRYRLSWYDTEDLTTPVQSHAPVVPRFLQGPKPTQTYFATQADVFRDIPGQEIIGVHVAERSSQTAISIYSWEGTLLSETWHDGQIMAVRYFAAENILLCLGVNSEKTWSERGHPQGPGFVYPMVVFAFEPVPNRLDSHLAMETPGADRPLWCLVLLPADSMGFFEWDKRSLVSLPPQSRRDCFARVDLFPSEYPSIQVSWLLKPDGTAEALPADDAYQSTEGVPDRESLLLVPFRSIVARSVESES